MRLTVRDEHPDHQVEGNNREQRDHGKRDPLRPQEQRARIPNVAPEARCESRFSFHPPPLPDLRFELPLSCQEREAKAFVSKTVVCPLLFHFSNFCSPSNNLKGTG